MTPLRRMRKYAPAALAFACALGGTLLVLPRTDATADAESRVPVVVLTATLPRGAGTDEVRRHAEVRELAPEAVADGALASLDELPEGVLAAATASGQQLTDLSFAADRVAAIGPGYVVTSVRLAAEQWLGAVKVAGTTVDAWAISEDDGSVAPIATGAIVVDAPAVDDVQPGEDAVVAIAVRRESLAEVLRAATHARVWLVGG
ncbi:MAG: hypothetical protein RL283_221 [Actinomycetota bacterium]